MTDKKLLTPREVADLIQVPISTVYQWVFYQKIPVVKISNRLLRFDYDQICEWLAAKTSPVSPRCRVPKNQGKPGRPRGRPRKDDKIDQLVEAAKQEVLRS